MAGFKISDLIGKRIEKLCPLCGGRYVIRQNSQARNYFLGCERWPKCKMTTDIPEELLMREAGQASFLDD